MKRIFTVLIWLLVICFAVPITAQTNYFRVQNPAGEGQDFETWTAAITYLNEQPELEEKQVYEILVLQAKGAQVDIKAGNALMPNKPAILSSSEGNVNQVDISGSLDLLAPFTFDKVWITASDLYIYANGHELTFTENVKMEESTSKGVYLYGGGSLIFSDVATESIEHTSLILNGGRFTEIYGGGEGQTITGSTSIRIGGKVGTTAWNWDTFYGIHGGDALGKVHNDQGTATAQIFIEGNAEIIGFFIYGGGGHTDGMCDNTKVVISGNANVSGQIYAAARNGHVNTATLEIKENPNIGYNSGSKQSYWLHGGSEYGTVDNTYVNISGGTFHTSRYGDALICGGCWFGTVNEDTHINITGGTGIHEVYGGNAGGNIGDQFEGEVKGTAHITISGGEIDDVIGGSGKYTSTGVNAVDIQITGGKIGSVYGGGELGRVGDISVSMNGGEVENLLLVKGKAIDNSTYNWTIEGETKIHVTDGTVGTLGLIKPTSSDATEYGNFVWGENSTVDIIVEGKASISNFESYNTDVITVEEKRQPFKSATLTFKDCGTAESPYYLNSDIKLFTKVVAENSYINMGEYGFVVKEESPLTISGKTWQKPQHGFQLKSWDKNFESTALSPHDKIVILEGNDFDITDFSFDTNKELYKVGNTIRYNDGTLPEDIFHTVTITNKEPEKGSLSVVWDGTEVNNEDKVPEVTEKPLTVTITPKEGYSGTLYVNEEQQTESPINIVCNEDKTFSVTFTENAYAITYEQPANGTINVTDAGGSEITSGKTVLFNSVVKITTTPEIGYELEELSVMEGDNAIHLDKNNSFTMPAGNVTITATYKKVNYQVQLKQTEGGTISADKGTAQIGDVVTLSYELQDRYNFVNWTVTDESQQPIEVKAGETSGTYSFTMPASNVTVTATFEKEKDPEPPVDPDPISYYNIYVEEVCDGAEVTTSKNVVREGGSVNIYVEKDTEHYTFDNFKVYIKRSYYGAWEELKEGTQPGEYTVNNIWTHIYVKAEGAEEKEDPTGIEQIESVKVYTKDGSLFVQTPKREQVIIISMSGAVVKNEEQIGLKQYHGLNQGIYIVRIGNQVYKIRLH